MRFSLSTLVALGALQTLGVNAQDSTSCITGCSTTMQAPNAAYNCDAQGNSAACICASSEFAKGMAECARSCGAQDGDIVGNLASGFCVGQAQVVLPPASAASSEASSAPATTSEAAASTSEAPASTSEAPATTEAASSSAAPTSEAAPETTTEAAESAPASTSAAAESTAAESTAASASASASATDKASTTEGAAGADATSGSSKEDDKDEESSGSGLSKSAQIGIGVGVAAGVLALLGIVLCFLWRRRSQRNNLPRGNTAISHPMPAGGNNYPSNSTDQGSIAEKGGYDLEMMSHRYEDMLPRQKPRTMV